MKHVLSVARLAMVVLAFATGCAAHAGNGDASSALPRPDLGLQGTWHGTFGQVMTGDSGQIHGDIVTQINEDGTYKTTWITRVVAGSARGGRLALAGTVVSDGSSVTFREPSGASMTLRRVGDTLYGTRLDPATKRVTVAVELHRVPTPQAP